MTEATIPESTRPEGQADGLQSAGSPFEAIPPVRELSHRHSEGIDVILLWDADTNRVSIVLTDERSGEALSFSVDPGEALSAFYHPCAYAARASVTDGDRRGLVEQRR